MPRRLSARKVNEIREKLKKDSGDHCHIGKLCKFIQGKDYRELTGNDLEVHHIDGNPANNNPYNHVLACGPCNKALHRQPSKRYMRERVRERIGQVMSGKEREKELLRATESQRSYQLMELIKNGLTFTQRKNINGEWKFLKWVEGKITQHGYWPLEDVKNAGAVIADVSIQTTERWAVKLISSEGRYDTHTLKGGTIVLIFKGRIPKENLAGPSQTSGSGFDSSAQSR